MNLPPLLSIALGFGLTLTTAWMLGKTALRGFGLKLFRIEEDLFALLTGACLLSGIVFLLCALRIASGGAFLGVALASALAALRSRAFQRSQESLPPLSRLQWLFFLTPFTIYGLLYLGNALAPETSPDGSTYHLGNVLRWHTEGGFVRYTGSMYADLSQGLEMLFLFAFSFGRHTAATLIHCAFLFALPWLLLSYGRRFGLAWPFLFGGMMLYLSPVVGRAGTSAYNDVAVGCFVFGLFYAMQIWAANRRPGWLIIIGLFAGFCYALKYTAGVALIVALAFVLWTLRRTPAHWLRVAGIIVGCAALCILPWMSKNWLWVGNPLAPFFNALFPNPHISIRFEHEYRASMALFQEIKSRWQIPLQVTMNGAYVGGLFGPWLLLAPLGLLAIGNRHGRALLLTAALFAAPAISNSSTRLLIPFATFMAPAVGLTLSRVRFLLPVLIATAGVVCWPSVVNRYASAYAWKLEMPPWSAALRISPEKQYLESRLGDSYVMARAVDRLVPQTARVLMIDQIPQGYTSRQLWHYYESTEGWLGFLALWRGFDRGMQPTWDMRFEFSAQPVRSLRVLQTATADEEWSVSEMRVYRDGAEIARDLAFHFAARPAPWDAALAFDNRLLSSWRTWEAIRPGMFLREEFGRSLTVDRVSLVCSQGQWRSRLRLEGMTANGAWRTLAEKPRIIDIPSPDGMRLAANGELHALGFNFVLVRSQSGPGADLDADPARWKMTKLHQVGTLCLYRVD